MAYAIHGAPFAVWYGVLYVYVSICGMGGCGGVENVWSVCVEGRVCVCLLCVVCCACGMCMCGVYGVCCIISVWCVWYVLHVCCVL